MIKQLTNTQIESIVTEVSKKWNVVNHGNYYKIIDKKTGQNSNEGGSKNLISYHFYDKIESMYLQLINEHQVISIGQLMVYLLLIVEKITLLI
jgi:hypothetical protein